MATSILATASALVKREATTPAAARASLLAMTVDAQHPVVRGLIWILENRTKPDGKRMSQRALSLAAGLTAAHVGQILGGFQSADIDRRTAIAIARAANVRLEWLLTGSGPREPFDASDGRTLVEYDDQYPNRARAVVAARALGYTEEAIAQVQGQHFAGQPDMEPEEWLDEIKTADRRLRRGVAPMGTVVASDLDEEPPGFAAPKRGKGKPSGGKKGK